jgi:adenine-specific DNA-methyltransferase
MGKEYDKSTKIEDFVEAHRLILPELLRVTKPGGSICWQVGYHVSRASVLTPLDYLVYEIFNSSPELFLQNRIIWTFGHGLHSKKKFSGRHEVILWFSKGKDYYFNLDGVRVPQKYPGKTYSKGEKKGQPSGNPLGKNPGDVWEIPNVKAKHVEKTDHPCQFPVALAQRVVRALTPANGRVLDTYMGSGTTGVAALLEGRKFVGAEIDEEYYAIARTRCEQVFTNEIKYRPLDKPVQVPNPNSSVARKPENFA